MPDTDLTALGDASPDALEGEAMILMSRAAMIRITRELIPVFSAKLTDAVMAEITRQEAARARELLDARVASLTAELREVNRRAVLADAAVASADVNDRLSGRVQVAACESETAHLTAELHGARADAAAARAAETAAGHAAKRANAEATVVLEALDSPLTSPVGMATAAYGKWLEDSGFWRHDPQSETARSLVRSYLGPTGVGAEVQRDAISAYLVGDPLALAVGGTDLAAGGETVYRATGAPPLVTPSPRLSGHQAAAAADVIPPVRPSDPLTRPASSRPGF